MRFVISTQRLNQLLNKCLNVVSLKPTIPILSNIVIEAANDELILTATDMVVGVKVFTTEVKILEEGGTTLPARKFGALIRELTTPDVEITSLPNQMTEIVANTSHFKMKGVSHREFPAFDIRKEGGFIRLTQSELKQIIYKTAFCVAKDDERHEIMGLFMQVTKKEILFMAMDGKRLARASIPLKVEPSCSGCFILPLKAVEEILKNLRDEGDVLIYATKERVSFEIDEAIITCVLVLGDYPNIDRAIPEKCEASFKVHREELMTLLRQISLFIGEMNPAVKFTFSQGELKVTAHSADLGEGKVMMPVNYSGKPIEVAFNPLYFLDILKHSRGELVSIGLVDQFNPGIVTDVEGEMASPTSNPLYMLMPLRFDES